VRPPEASSALDHARHAPSAQVPSPYADIPGVERDSRTRAREADDPTPTVVAVAAGVAGTVSGLYGLMRVFGREVGPPAHLLLACVVLYTIVLLTLRGRAVRAGAGLTMAISTLLCGLETIYTAGVWHGAMPYLAVGGAIASATLPQPWGRRVTALAVVLGVVAGVAHTADLPLMPGQPHDDRVVLDVLDHVLASVALAAAVHAFVRRRRAAEAAAVREDELRGRFIRVMCHQLRTPLNGVLGMAQALSAGVVSEPGRGLVATLERSARALLGLFDDVLDYTQAVSGQLHLSQQPFLLRTLLLDVGGLFEARARDRGLTLRIDVAAVPPGLTVMSDAGRLRQVLTNLVANAVKFTERGEVELLVERLDDLRWRVRVRDTGIGIAADALPRLFQPFVQADGSIAERFGGSGLGLAISRRVVEALGGTLEARSTPGAGSTFELVVPLPMASQPLSELEPTAGPGLRGRVLVVEDNRVNQRVVAWMLGKLGLDVHIVETAEAALERLEHTPADVVLMDVQLPGMDGLSATRRIRQLYGTRVPVVGLSAHATDRDRAAALEAGMLAYVTKPVERAALARALGAALTGAPEPPRPPAGTVQPPSPQDLEDLATQRFQRTVIAAMGLVLVLYVVFAQLVAVSIPGSLYLTAATLPLCWWSARDRTGLTRTSNVILGVAVLSLLSGALLGRSMYEASLPLFMMLGPMAAVLRSRHARAWTGVGMAAGPLLGLAQVAELYRPNIGTLTPWGPVMDLGTSAVFITYFVERFAHDTRNRETRWRALADARLRFLASLGHEIRTPMNGVLGMSELLASEALTDEQREQLQTLRSSAQELLRIVDQLIDFVRLEEGRLVLSDAPLRPEVELSQAIAAARQELVSDLPPPPLDQRVQPSVPAWVRGDAQRVRQLARALVSNALRFSQRGRIEAELSWSDGALELRVSDGGPGMTAEAAALAFEPFNAERSQRGLGIGLGLATARHLTARMGGTLSLVSTPDGGTTVRLTIPAPLTEAPQPPAPWPQRRAPQPPMIAATPPAARPATTPSASHELGVRVLVVDDDVTNRQVATLMLARLGVVADPVATGLDAVAAAGRGGHRLVLLDLHLPDVDGAEVARRIRAAEDSGQHLPIVALTGSDDPAERQAALAAGVDRILDKPLRAAALREVLEQTATSG
jgi:signal transduction histidine kinase/DNA-binding response OmpR family regulator